MCKASIASGKDITTAYAECGFADYSGFYRTFRKEFGMSPNEFKNSSEKIKSR
ncbi:helix-turn-helix domain-containing protein [Streptococcus milleri]